MYEKSLMYRCVITDTCILSSAKNCLKNQSFSKYTSNSHFGGYMLLIFITHFLPCAAAPNQYFPHILIGNYPTYRLFLWDSFVIEIQPRKWYSIHIGFLPTVLFPVATIDNRQSSWWWDIDWCKYLLFAIDLFLLALSHIHIQSSLHIKHCY